jgi:hypothetical protein
MEDLQANMVSRIGLCSLLAFKTYKRCPSGMPLGKHSSARHKAVRNKIKTPNPGRPPKKIIDLGLQSTLVRFHALDIASLGPAVSSLWVIL